MDALALLCTLYAEGPVTLARLRQQNCATIEDVSAMDAQALATILVSTEATAQRFQREARNLRERVGADEPSTSRPTSTLASTPTSARPAVLDRVLALWRERDERDNRLRQVDSPNDADGERVEILQPAKTSRTFAAGAAVSGALAAARFADAPPAERSIHAGAVDGLDAAASSALAAAGVRDLRALATCDTLVVARASGISWSHLARLRSLARRLPGFAPEHMPAFASDHATDLAPEPASAHSPEPIPAEKVSPSERPQAEQTEQLATLDRARDPAAAPAPQYAAHGGEGAGGPFA